MKKIILFLILLILIIPIGYASDNDTSRLEISDNDNLLSSTEIYFNSSAGIDGNGSKESPYNYLSASRLSNGATVYFASGEYNFDYSKTVSDLIIIGENESNTVINAKNLKLTTSSNLSLFNITLNGLAIVNRGNLNTYNVTFMNNKGAYTDSYGNIYGGVIYSVSSGKSVINASTFINNTATYGGAIYTTSTLFTVDNSTFTNNSANKFGGAIASLDANINVLNSQFINNTAIQNAGGSLYIYNSPSAVVNRSVFKYSNATYGGSIADINSTSIFTSNQFSSNNASYQGGAVYKMYGEIHISDSAFTSNEALDGGAVFVDNSSMVEIKNSNFTSNIAKNIGGAIYSVMNLNETVTSNNYSNNKASSNRDYYKTNSYNLFIGSGNYLKFKGIFDVIENIPSQYDLRDYGWVSPVKNQKSSGNCWAFTTLAALESCILKITNITYDFSEENMKNVIAFFSDYGWNLMTNTGGYDDMGVGYLLSWLGAVEEYLDEFNDKTILSPVLESSVHVQNLVYLTRQNYTDNDGVKEAILKYGAVATGLYYSSSYRNGNSYYFDGISSSNHAVTIVGWDDNYSRTNFKTIPEGDGAWICKNSWGESWGDKGYFYISYYDHNCVKLGSGEKSTYTFILNDTVTYDKNYQYDIIGITDYFVTGKNTIWYENIFKATDNEMLAAFSTYFNATNTTWAAEIYVNDILKSALEGVSPAGYFTFNLNEFIPLIKGDTFKIVLKISADELASFPISEKTRSNRILYSEGTSFFSYDGKTWTDLYDYKLNMSEYGHSYDSQVACIKAFTVNCLNTTLSIDDLGFVGVKAPVNIIATVKDCYGNLVNNGSVKFNIDSKNYTVSVSAGKAVLNYQFNSSGLFKINASYLSNDYYNESLASVDVTAMYTSANLTVKILNMTYGENLTVSNILTYEGLPISGIINVIIGSNNYSLDANSQKTFLNNLTSGNYTANAYYSNISKSSTTFTISKSSLSMSLKINQLDIDKFNLTFILSKPVNETIKVTVNSNNFTIKSANGIASLFLSGLDINQYLVKGIVSSINYENASASGNFSVTSIKTYLIAPNVTMYYHNGTRFIATLVDKDNNPLAGQSVAMTINGIESYRVTNSYGAVSMALNLISGTYPIYVKYLGKGNYSPSNTTGYVTVNPTIIASDLVKYYRNASQFYATILTQNGGRLANKNVSMNINGVIYTRQTDSNGVLKLNLNLAPGKYILTTTNPLNGEKYSNTITILSKFVDNNDLTKYYRNASKYSLKLLDDAGSIVKGVNVTFNINGVFYTRLTDSDGIASIAINLAPGKYIITAEYNGLKASNNITVLSTIKSSDLTMRYRDGSKFIAATLDGTGRISPNQNIVFNINGVLYNRISNSTGEASLSINLQKGKYIITTTYNGLNKANTITIN